LPSVPDPLRIQEDNNLLPRLLKGSCILDPVCLFCCDVDVQLSQQRFGRHPGDLGASGSPFLAIFTGQLPFILFIWSLHARLLILAHLMTLWISRMSSSSCEFCPIERCACILISSTFRVFLLFFFFFFIFLWNHVLQENLIQCACPRVRLMVIQLSRQRFGGRPGGLGCLVLHFLRFLQAAYRPYPVYMVPE